jgi:TP901 family phage tail tape measure protein
MSASMMPPLVGVLRGNVSHFVASMGEAKAAAAEASTASSTAFQGLAGFGKAALFGVAGAALAVGAVSIHMAGDFQQSMTQLVTGAGESKANIDLVSKGILSMAGDVGVSAQQLASGMYMVESAGFHGAQGLEVMKTAAMGAKVGGADMSTVADALTSALNAYHEPASKATSVTNDLIATVASGKMHMEDLAGALGTVLPAASTAGVSLKEVTAAIATMTMQGTPAADAATYLRQTILQMENPSARAQKALKDVGLSGQQLAHDLGSKGLAATLAEATDAIGKKFPAGSAEYVAHLADMVGGTKSMQAALELTGGNMKVFQNNVTSIGAAAAAGGGQVQGWSDVQKDFNFQVDQAKASLESMGIQLGLVLIPIIQRGIVVVGQIVHYFKQHKDAAAEVAAAIAGPLVVAIGLYTIGMIQAAIATIAATWPLIAIMVAVAALSAGVIYAYNHWGWFRTAVNAAGSEIKSLMSWLSVVVPPIWHGFTTDISNAWNGLKAFGSWISNTFGPILEKMGGALKSAGGFLNSINPWAKHSPSLVENVESGVAAITGHYAGMARSIQGSMSGVGGAPGFGGAGGGFSSAAGGAAGAGKDVLQRLDQLIALDTDVHQFLETIATAVTTPINVSGADGALYALVQKVMRGRQRALVGG